MLRRLSVVSVVSALVLAPAAAVIAAGPAPATTPAAHQAKPKNHHSTHPVVLFSSDGMRPDLMQRYAQAGGCRPTAG